MNPKLIAFALITFYPNWYRGKLRTHAHTDKVRGDLALEFIKKATKLGYQVVVVEGKSSKNFRRELKNFSSIKLIKRRSYKRSPAKRQAFKAASKLPEVKVIITTEAEKISLIDNIKLVAKPIISNEADIVVPKRENKLFKETYPDYLYESEVEGNRIANKELRSNGLLKPREEEMDIFFGPKVFSNTPKILPLFLKRFQFDKADKFLNEYLDPEELANTQYFPVIVAFKKGFKVKSVEVPFSYPKIQKENESIGAREVFEEKRNTQRLGLLLQIMYLLRYLKNK